MISNLFHIDNELFACKKKQKTIIYQWLKVISFFGHDDKKV